MAKLNDEIYLGNNEPTWFNKGIDNNDELKSSNQGGFFKPFSIGVRDVDGVRVQLQTDKPYYNLPCSEKVPITGLSGILNDDYALLMYSDTAAAVFNNGQQKEIYYNDKDAGVGLDNMEFSIINDGGTYVSYFDDGFASSRSSTGGKSIGGGQTACEVFHYTISPKVFFDHRGRTAPTVFNGDGVSTVTITDGLTGPRIGELPNIEDVGKTLIGQGVICIFEDNGWFLEDVERELFYGVLETPPIVTEPIAPFFDASEPSLFSNEDVTMRGGEWNGGGALFGNQYFGITNYSSSEFYSSGFLGVGDEMSVTMNGVTQTFIVGDIKTGDPFGIYTNDPELTFNSILIATTTEFVSSSGINNGADTNGTITLTQSGVEVIDNTEPTIKKIPIMYNVPRNLIIF
jgi:hypothetical protein